MSSTNLFPQVSPPHSESSDPNEQLSPIPFSEQVKRGWHWVVFVWQMLRRMGGPIDWLLAFWTLISLLTNRFFSQLGLPKK